tara:strand:+ start:202 stop:648 length:447 start_codon:yes stop_codon:yes gene_type:complete
MSRKISLVTGGFDPLHSGHIDYFESAKNEGDLLLVGINSNQWLQRKKGRYFLDYKERVAVIKALYMVSDIIEFDDSDDTAIDAIKKTKELYPGGRVVFCNGGDRGEINTPEYAIFINDNDVSFKFNVGGSKTNSSSKILDRWENQVKE